jgi:hypothetical protein
MLLENDLVGRGIAHDARAELAKGQLLLELHKMRLGFLAQDQTLAARILRQGPPNLCALGRESGPCRDDEFAYGLRWILSPCASRAEGYPQ